MDDASEKDDSSLGWDEIEMKTTDGNDAIPSLRKDKKTPDVHN